MNNPLLLSRRIIHLFLIPYFLIIIFSISFAYSNTVQQKEDNINQKECTQRHPKTTEHKHNWKWDIDAEHPCNIPKITYSQLLKDYGTSGLPTSYYSKPIIIRADRTSNQKEKFKQMTTSQNIVNYFGSDFNITLSSSNSYSDFRKSMSIQEYIEEVVSTETYPNQLSNETWYFFGETFTSIWQEFLEGYTLPPCSNCIPKYAATSFGIGNKGSGIQWHFHGNGLSENIHGRKYWLLYPEGKRVDFHSNYTSRHWMEEFFKEKEKKEEDSLLWHCTVEEGESIYFPSGWYHATINLDRYNVFVSTFLRED